MEGIGGTVTPSGTTVTTSSFVIVDFFFVSRVLVFLARLCVFEGAEDVVVVVVVVVAAERVFLPSRSLPPNSLSLSVVMGLYDESSSLLAALALRFLMILPLDLGSVGT